MNEEKNNKLKIIIIILSILVIGLTSFIVYDKFIKKDEEKVSNVDNSNNQEDNESSANDSKLILDSIDFGKIFNEAERLYAGFTGYRNVELDYETKYEDNYYLVKDTILSDMNLLKQELNKYFVDDIIDTLLNTMVDNKYPLYKEVNGKVYRFGGYVGQYDYLHRENNLSLEKVNDSKVIIHDKIVWNMEESQIKNYDYTLERDTDGNFKFINFELPASFYNEI